MKFRKISFQGHPILGDSSFDFTDTKGNTIDTIIVAGENGCGKTVLLNELFEYNPSQIVNNRQGKIIAEIELNEGEVNKILSNNYVTQCLPQGITNKLITIVQDFNIHARWEQISVRLCDQTFSGEILQYKNEPLFKRIFSNVEVNFSPSFISAITGKNIDQISVYSIKSSTNLATEITQLLIDIKSLDDAELADWVNDNNGKVPPDEIKSVRMKRFTNAFSQIFKTKHFKGVRSDHGNKVVLFEEHGKEVAIDKLSSGEKQIVFRGGFLLKDKLSIEGAYVLIDEPEISLHPKWQMEILPFIKQLFTNEMGIQTSQIIVATHSPFIIHNDNRVADKVVVLRKNQFGYTEVVEAPHFYSWGSQKIIQAAFNLDLSFVSESQLIVFVEGETDELYFNRALDVFGYDKSKIRIEWIGRRTEKGKIENSGDSALNNAYAFLKANRFISGNICLLYDNDTDKPIESDGCVHVRRMMKNDSNTTYQKGVENLLSLPSDFKYQQYYKVSESIDGYGAKRSVQQLDKVLLCNSICREDDESLMRILINIKNEIDLLLQISAQYNQ